jgi:hypothetical protein
VHVYLLEDGFGLVELFQHLPEVQIGVSRGIAPVSFDPCEASKRGNLISPSSTARSLSCKLVLHQVRTQHRLQRVLGAGRGIERLSDLQQRLLRHHISISSR